MSLNYTGYFITPIYEQKIDKWIKPLNKACDKHIKQARKRDIPFIKKRNKDFKRNLKDFGLSAHSGSLSGLPEFKEIEEYVIKCSDKILDQMGYNTQGYKMFMTEMWVQEFSKNGAGHHETHIHYDNHISGFYFLKGSDKTSYPIFKDPRLAKIMSSLPEKNPWDTTFASHAIKYHPEPGTLILFPSFLEHGFPIDHGIEPFRFMHFNLQAVRRTIINK